MQRVERSVQLDVLVVGRLFELLEFFFLTYELVDSGAQLITLTLKLVDLAFGVLQLFLHLNFLNAV